MNINIWRRENFFLFLKIPFVSFHTGEQLYFPSLCSSPACLFAHQSNSCVLRVLNLPVCSLYCCPLLPCSADTEHYSLPPSHHKLGHLFARQVQGEVLVCSFDGERVLLCEHAGALVGEALIAAAVTQLLGAAKGVTVRGVLAELCPLQAVLLIEADVVKGLAVPVGGRLRLPAHRSLRGKNNRSNIKKYTSKCRYTKMLSQLSAALMLK